MTFAGFWMTRSTRGRCSRGKTLIMCLIGTFIRSVMLDLQIELARANLSLWIRR
jgi:hypothetical protein